MYSIRLHAPKQTGFELKFLPMHVGAGAVAFVRPSSGRGLYQ